MQSPARGRQGAVSTPGLRPPSAWRTSALLASPISPPLHVPGPIWQVPGVLQAMDSCTHPSVASQESTAAGRGRASVLCVLALTGCLAHNKLQPSLHPQAAADLSLVQASLSWQTRASETQPRAGSQRSLTASGEKEATPDDLPGSNAGSLAWHCPQLQACGLAAACNALPAPARPACKGGSSAHSCTGRRLRRTPRHLTHSCRFRSRSAR